MKPQISNLKSPISNLKSQISNRRSQISNLKSQTPNPRSLPDGWRWVRLGEVCEKQTGIRDPRIEPDTAFQYVDITSVSNTQKCITEARPILGKDAPSRAREVIRVNDVIVATTRPNLNAVAQVPPELDNQICSTGFCVLRAGAEILPDYLFAFVRHESFIEALTDLVKGALYPAINDGQVMAQPIPLPPLPEQRRIAGVLREQMTAVEKARTAAQTRLAAVKALPAAFLRQVFPQPGQPLPDGWRWVKLGEVASQGPDNGVFKRRDDFGSGVPIVNVSDLYRSLHVEMSLTERVRVTEDELRRYQIAPGDLFFCRSSLKREGIGWCCLVKKVDEPSVFECHVMRLRLRMTDALPEYVAYYWQHPSVRENVIGNSRTATMTTMNQQDLGGVNIPLPSLAEQQRIAGVLNEQMTAVEKARTVAEEELNTINALPAALLRRAFNGEI